MHTVGRLARRFGLSRSTLLYYDSIGLLSPGRRTTAGYRLYSDRDARRLEQICGYREAGIRLSDIAKLLDGVGRKKSVAILERRLSELNTDITTLRRQQHLIIRILGRNSLRARLGVMDAAAWSSLMRAAGLGDDEMLRWHAEFERLWPQSHREFLAALGMSAKDVRALRRWAARAKTSG